MAAGANGVKGRTEIVELSRAQQTIARRASETRATVPEIELTAEAEIEPEAEDALIGRLIRACALALRDVPRANAAYRDGHFELYSRVNIAVVVPVDGEQAIVVLFDADQKSPVELSDELAGLAERARSGALTSPEQSGATFTLTHVNTPGVGRVSAMINPPQAAALAAGAVRASAIVRDGAILPGHVLTLTLACDHRVLYGEQAARFLSTIKDLLEVGNL